MKILVGADPEIFVKNRMTGSLVSAHGLNTGTKESPLAVPCGAVQVDGMALEYNIDPASTEAEFVEFNRRVLSSLTDSLPAALQLAYQVTTAHFGAEYIESMPDSVQELGCEPDFNAYTGEVNDKPDVNTPFRTAAGHVHIGFTDGANAGDPAHMGMCNTLVKELDVYLGLASVLLDPDTDRRNLYGAAGACRYKSYGVEYRTLSNFWVGDAKLTAWVYRQVQAAVKSVMSGTFKHSERETAIQEIINKSCVEGAKMMIQHLNLEMPDA